MRGAIKRLTRADQGDARGGEAAGPHVITPIDREEHSPPGEDLDRRHRTGSTDGAAGADLRLKQRRRAGTASPDIIKQVTA